MRWYARPENHSVQLRVAPRLASWNKADDPDQVRLREYLDDTEALLAGSRIDGPWALRLDVGLPDTRDLLDAADLDNFAYPLASRLGDPGLVSVWCTKRHSRQSLVHIEAATKVDPPSTKVLHATPTASASTTAFKEQIHAAVAGSAELAPGPVRLELSFVVGPRRNWLNLWKQTIDSLDPLLGRTNPDRAWHPRDGRITELGMHLAVDPAAGYDVAIGIAATQTPEAAARRADQEPQREHKIGGQRVGPLEFRDDDAGYLDWLGTHSYGYVVNIARRYSVAAARLHRADCRTINGQNPHNGPWTGPYVKICTEQLPDLEQWVTDTLGEPVSLCGTCRPGPAR